VFCVELALGANVIRKLCFSGKLTSHSTIQNMSEHEFKEGDIVQLKSGGPRMTIKGIGEYGVVPHGDNALCEWFDNKTRLQDVFEFHSLVKG
jgi:uncharacterized protein YodC (DUF2158 family)